MPHTHKVNRSPQKPSRRFSLTARCVSAVGLAAFMTLGVSADNVEAQVDQADTYSGGKARVNNSAKLRALAEGISAASCRMAAGIDTEATSSALAAMQNNFNTILTGLEQGSSAMGMPGEERASAVLKSIWAVQEDWAPMDAAVTSVLNGNTGDAATISNGRGKLFEDALILASDVSGAYSDPQELLQSDAITFNFIGRQRELANSMSRMVCELATGTASDSTRDDLKQAVNLFDASLNALRNGFPDAGISPPPNEAVAESLTQMATLWTEDKAILDAVMGGGEASEEDVMRTAALVEQLSVVINNTVTLYLISTPGQDGVYRVPLEAFARNELSKWLSDPALLDALRAQNTAHDGLSEDEVIALDQQWRAEANSGDGPLISEVLSHPVSTWLLDQQNATAGFVTEVFVMDNLGLNVAQSAVTSDYWQGDEAKWQETYKLGNDALHISEVEFDDSTGYYQSQASMTITDPDTGEAIGAITFGVNVQSLM